ncbi:MAG: hypothetical protein LBU32_17200 [Clostridiales bacterium]|jgi:hypothetical protein|nr:hypothetical protein [Clostridiales bacterium]
MALIMQHVFTTNQGAQTLLMSEGLINLQAQLEDLSLFHALNFEEKGFVFYPMQSEGLYILGQASRFPSSERAAYIQHNYVLDKDAFSFVKANAYSIISRIKFFESPDAVGGSLKLLKELPLFGSQQFPTYLPDFNWEAMVNSALSGYISNWCFSNSYPDRERLARMILTRFINVLPFEYLSRMPGMHTSTSRLVSGSIAIRFPFGETDFSRSLFIDKLEGAARPHYQPLLISHMAKSLKANLPMTCPDALSDLLEKSGGAFSKLSSMKDILALFTAISLQDDKETLKCFLLLAADKRYASSLLDLEKAVASAFVAALNDGRRVDEHLMAVKTEATESFFRLIERFPQLAGIIEDDRTPAASKSLDEPEAQPKKRGRKTALSTKTQLSYDLARDLSNANDFAALDNLIGAYYKENPNNLNSPAFILAVSERYRIITDSEASSGKNVLEIADSESSCVNLSYILKTRKDIHMDVWAEALFWKTERDSLKEGGDEALHRWYLMHRSVLRESRAEHVFLRNSPPEQTARAIYDHIASIWQDSAAKGRLRSLSRELRSDESPYWREAAKQLQLLSMPADRARKKIKEAANVRNYLKAYKSSFFVRLISSALVLVFIYAFVISLLYFSGLGEIPAYTGPSQSQTSGSSLYPEIEP